MDVPTKCAICGYRSEATTVYRARLSAESFKPAVFSARRLPDRQHYQWVRCDSCGLFRSDPISDVDLETLYAQSTFDYDDEVPHLAQTYVSLLKPFLESVPGRDSIVEVGGGNGFFLDAARRFGFTHAIEIEPSGDALEHASEEVRREAIAGVMEAGLIDDDSTDVVALFHVLDHLPDPSSTLEACWKALKPSGLILIAVHDVESWSARLLRERSPIFDVEHTYLYSRSTGGRLLEKVGFEQVRSGGYSNRYSVKYLFHLLPLPPTVKGAVLAQASKTGLAKLSLRVPLGNMWLSGRKPAA